MWEPTTDGSSDAAADTTVDAPLDAAPDAGGAAGFGAIAGPCAMIHGELGAAIAADGLSTEGAA